MPDNLRDRIAAAIKAEDEKPHVCPFDGEPTMASYDRLADAVIRELGLKQQTNEMDTSGPYRHRYVTEWETDD